MTEPTRGIVLASSQVAAGRVLSEEPGEVGDVVTDWWYVAEDASYQSKEDYSFGLECDLELTDGSVHAFSGRYGPQQGDGVPTVTRTQAEAQTTEDLRAFFSRLP